jgi:hypothetical protein
MKFRFLSLILALQFSLISSTDGKSIEYSVAEQTSPPELQPPVFSHKHGFYYSPFTLTITPLISGSAIYYTTDGSAPGPSSGTLYSTPLYIDTTSVIRAAEIRNNQAGKIATCTYLFPDDILHQPNDPEGYPSTWGPYTGIPGTSIADYEMDPEIMADPMSAEAVKQGLLDLPVISLVTDRGYLFSKSQDPVTGGIYIYTGPPLTNTTNGLGFGWERPASFEYFDARDSVSLQVDCGLEIQGGHGRRPEKSPKHSFRLTFKSTYGPPKLNYPIFAGDADSVFNTIILRAGFGNTWIHWSQSERSMAQYLRDRWTKDTHRAMGHISSHGIYVNLFINGLYWGIYNPSERLDKDFAAMYLGGDAEEYDVIKDYAEVADGDINAWNTMMSLANSGLATTEAYQGIRGNLPDGTQNPGMEPLVDAVSLADYMLLNFYGGNWDWDHHNWVAIRNRNNPWRGFQFFCWDGEHMVESVDANVLAENNNNCPSRVFQQMRQNAEFRRLFADRVQKHCFNGGSLTPASAAGRWKQMADQIEKAVAAESARWGDYRRDVHPWQSPGPFDLYTKENHWLPQINYIMNTYFPNRTDVFINTLRTAGLFPAVNGPEFLINGFPLTTNSIEENDILTMTASQGDIYFTTDGSDPVTWKPAPSISTAATKYLGQIILKQSTHIKARCYSGGTWSATSEKQFQIAADYYDIKITEIHYHPMDQGFDDSPELEFIELKNTGQSTLDLGGMRFADGISFKFPEEIVLMPQGFIVIASNASFFRSRYGFWPFASYDGYLDNGGERVVLVTRENDTICSVKYLDGNGWPENADGNGFSLVPFDINPEDDQTRPQFWRSSYRTGGSPGVDDILIPEADPHFKIVTLFQNWPNPFREYTNIMYNLSEDSYINISVFDLAGKHIITLKEGSSSAGFNSFEWRGMNLNHGKLDNGIYLVRIVARNRFGEGVATMKAVLTR